MKTAAKTVALAALALPLALADYSPEALADQITSLPGN
jgi:hypothetical protein